MENKKLPTTGKFGTLLESWAKMDAKKVMYMQDCITDYLEARQALDTIIVEREDSYRLMGIDLKLESFEDFKKNNFDVILRIVNQNTEADIPTVTFDYNTIPMWFRNDQPN